MTVTMRGITQRLALESENPIPSKASEGDAKTFMILVPKETDGAGVISWFSIKISPDGVVDG